MRIAVSGASGFIGTALCRFLRKFDYSVVTISKNDLENLTDSMLKSKIEGCYAVINLGGAPISRFWSKSYKEELYESRIGSTRRLVSIINKSVIKPHVFISTSAVGIYNRLWCHNEESKDYDNTFLSKLCVDWEAEAMKLSPDTRLVITRLGIVMDSSGGYLNRIQCLYKFGCLLVLGNKYQIFSWIALSDLMECYKFILFNDKISGVVNVCNNNLMIRDNLIAKISQKFKPFFEIRVADWVIKLFGGKASEIIVINQCAVPKVLINNGFEFNCDNVSDLMS